LAWIAEVEEVLRAEPQWDRCQFHRICCDEQGGFNFGTVLDQILRCQGPLIVIQKVQAPLLQKLRSALNRRVCVYSVTPSCSADLLKTCEEAFEAHGNGEPLVSSRELFAVLIVAKLARLGKWGGTALNKSFLWVGDIPNGGFPNEISDRREIAQVADAMFNDGILVGKKSEGKMKYALGDKATIEQILEDKSFENVEHGLQGFFDRSPRHLPARHLRYATEEEY
jgi:hypothetical protein